MVMYHEPVPPEGDLRRGQLRAIAQIFTTGDDDLADASGVTTFAGVIGPPGGTFSRESEEDVARRIATETFERSRAASTRILTGDQFQELWRRLEEAGIAYLPRWQKPDPPRDQPYFILEAGRRRWVFVRPPSARSREEFDETLDRQWKAWQATKPIVLVDFFNYLGSR
jgi:hypothetical protein